jgi:hypothetical protein
MTRKRSLERKMAGTQEEGINSGGAWQTIQMMNSGEVKGNQLRRLF